ncbi:winged helix-turn-helix domain-containing protein [Rhodococcus aerolatus]
MTAPGDRDDTVHLTDPRAMRALAHPTRLALLGELRAGGPRTVGMLSEALDEAPGSVSYHLGTLARHGLVVEVPERARDRREHWWRAAHRMTSWDELEALADPERRAAVGVLRRTVADHYAAELRRYLEVEPSLPDAWVAAATSSDVVLHLDADRLAELSAELDAVLRRWHDADPGPDQPGTQRVRGVVHAFRDPRTAP